MDKEWGRTANYIIPPPRQEEEEGVANVALVGGEEDEEMIDAAIENAENVTVGDLDQFQWP
jgi:23S rRNA G2445 N2-methylase RlmL